MYLALSWLRLRNIVFSKFNRLLSCCQLSRLLNPWLCGDRLSLTDHFSILLGLLLLLLCFLPLLASNICTETAHLLLLGLLFNYLEFSQVIRLVVSTLHRMHIRLVSLTNGCLGLDHRLYWLLKLPIRDWYGLIKVGCGQALSLIQLREHLLLLWK